MMERRWAPHHKQLAKRKVQSLTPHFPTTQKLQGGKVTCLCNPLFSETYWLSKMEVICNPAYKSEHLLYINKTKAVQP